MNSRAVALVVLATVSCSQSDRPGSEAGGAASPAGAAWPAASACEQPPPQPARGWFPVLPGRPYGVTKVTVQPGDARLVFAVTLERGLWRSEDGGRRFCPVQTPGLVTDVYPAPSDPAVVYARASEPQGLLRSGDGGRTWDVRAWPTAGARLIVDPNRPDTLYLTLVEPPGSPLVRSLDGGRTFTSLGPAPPEMEDVFDLAADPGNPDFFYASGPCSGNAVCLWRWTEATGTFELRFRETSPPGVPNLDFVIDGASRLFRIRPQHGRPLAPPRLERSLDGGATWSAVAPAPDGSTLLALAAPPFSRDLYLLTSGDTPSAATLLVTADGGDSWQTAARVPFAAEPATGASDFSLAVASAPERTFFFESGAAVFRVAAGQETPALVTLDVGRGHIQTAPSSSRVLYLLERHRIFRSEDGGATWQLRTTPDFERLAFAIDPGDPDRLWGAFAQSRGNARRGLYRSDDGGLHWQLVDPGLGSRPPVVTDLVIPRRAPRVIYVASSDGVAVSADQGSSWRLLGLTDGVQSLAVAEWDPMTGYVADHEGRIFVTRDGFATVTATTQPPGVDEDAALLIDPHDAQRLFLFLEDDAVLRTTDGGQSWSEATGFPTTSGRPRYLTFHPYRRGTVFLNEGGTLQVSDDGGMTWHLATDGLPAGQAPGSLAFDAHHGDTMWITIGFDGIWKTLTGGR